MHDKKTVVIADIQYLIVEGLQKLLSESEGFEFSALLKSVTELENYLVDSACDVLIIDVSILEQNDFQALGILKGNHPKMVVLVLCNQISRNEIGNLNRMGINTILYKNAEKKEFFEAMDAAIEGRKYYSPQVLDILLETREKPSSISHLTGTEKEIVCLIAEGMTTKEIAEKKNISFHTVMTHRKNIFRKLDINNVSELIMYAVRNGIIDNIEYYI